MTSLACAPALRPCVVPLLRALQPRVRDSALSAALEIFIAEENEHSAEFHALLRQLVQILWKFTAIS